MDLAVLVISFFVLLFLGIPIAYALCLSALGRCGAYVPLDTGALRASGTAAGDGSAITYTMPYAAAQYHLPYHHAEAQRGRYWDRRMMAAEGAAVAEDGKKAMKGGTD